MFDDRGAHPFLKQLNPEQRAATTYFGDTLLILAGAGTGKTTTLPSRLAFEESFSAAGRLGLP
jgi:hypothetical protein